MPRLLRTGLAPEPGQRRRSRNYPKTLGVANGRCCPRRVRLFPLCTSYFTLVNPAKKKKRRQEFSFGLSPRFFFAPFFRSRVSNKINCEARGQTVVRRCLYVSYFTFNDILRIRRGGLICRSRNRLFKCSLHTLNTRLGTVRTCAHKESPR